VKHLRKKNGGQASAFNAGFMESKGQIIAPLDGDDWWGSGKLAAVVSELEQDENLMAVSHAYYEVHEKTKEMYLRGPAVIEFLHLGTPRAARLAHEHWHFLVMGALTVRRTIFERVIPIPEMLKFSADGPIATSAMAAGVRVLPQPFSYYRFHESNLNAIDPQDLVKLRKKYEISEAFVETLYSILPGLGVSPQCVTELLDPAWVHVNRTVLSNFGGSRLKTYRTEMRNFNLEVKNPRLAYRLYRHLVVGTATLVLPPRTFYKLREWVGRQALPRFRQWAHKGRRS
jgi:glycosyltransferase involved in cell wall biosynthesis